MTTQEQIPENEKANTKTADDKRPAPAQKKRAIARPKTCESFASLSFSDLSGTVAEVVSRLQELEADAMAANPTADEICICPVSEYAEDGLELQVIHYETSAERRKRIEERNSNLPLTTKKDRERALRLLQEELSKK